MCRDHNLSGFTLSHWWISGSYLAILALYCWINRAVLFCYISLSFLLAPRLQTPSETLTQSQSRSTNTEHQAIFWRSSLAGSSCWGLKKSRLLVIDVLSGLGWLLGQVSCTVITLAIMRAALCRAAQKLPLYLHLIFLILVVTEWTRRGYKWHLPLPIIDYWPVSAKSNIVLFDGFRLGLIVTPVHVDSFFCVEVAQTHWFLFVFCFDAVC